MNSKILLILFSVFFFLKAIVIPAILFDQGFFEYYDLGLISSFLANTAHGKFFWVDDWNIWHLAKHFTPSLLVIAPFFSWFSSQLTLVFICNVFAIFGTIIFCTFILHKIEEKKFKPFVKFSLVIFCLSLFFANKYLNANMLASHFEVLYIPCALIVLVLFLKNVSFTAILIPLVFTLGLRQDAGYFLFFQLLSLFFLPKSFFPLNKSTKRNLFLSMGLCILYVIFAVKFVMPWAGADPHLRASDFWGSWGQTWGQIFFNALTHPIRVWRAFLDSGFFIFNEAFFYLGLLNPLQWLCAQCPAIIFYLADTKDKSLLHWYNSAFLLPGVYLSTFVGLIKLYSYVEKFGSKFVVYLSVIFLLLSCVVLGKSNKGISKLPYTFFHEAENIKKPFDEALSYAGKLYGKPLVSVSTDGLNYVFLPNKFQKFTLANAARAEVVLLQKRTFVKQEAQAKELLAAGNHIRKNLVYLGQDDNFEIYAGKQSH